jgi:hypothetical protein
VECADLCFCIDNEALLVSNSYTWINDPLTQFARYNIAVRTLKIKSPAFDDLNAVRRHLPNLSKPETIILSADLKDLMRHYHQLALPRSTQWVRHVER